MFVHRRTRLGDIFVTLHDYRLRHSQTEFESFESWSLSKRASGSLNIARYEQSYLNLFVDNP